MLEQALQYAQRGWHVMPLDGKRPATAHGWKDATTDTAQLVAWFAGAAGVNVGIACEPSGLLVVDLDSEEAVDWWEESEPVATAIVTTGRGQHWYYEGVGPSTAGRLAPGVDTRGRGGYVVAPPSWHPTTGARYEWVASDDVAPMPDGLLDRLAPPLPRRRPRYPVPGMTASAALRALCNSVRASDDGQRNNQLNLAAWDARTLGLEPRVVTDALIDAALDVGLSIREARATIASGLGVHA